MIYWGAKGIALVNNRAYTYIDRSRAVVGNRWMERTWSAFLGHTTGLLQKDGEFEWLEGRAGEFRVVTEEGALETLDFGETDWSEENSPLGATLVSVQRRPGLEIVLRTLALHEHPGLLRTVSVRNTGDEAMTVREVLAERLPVLRDGVRVYTDDFSLGGGAVEWVATEAGAALALEDRGLFFGQRRGGRFLLLAGEDGECAVRVTGPRRLEAGEAWRMEPTFLVPFTGRVVDAAATVYSQFLIRHLGQGEDGGGRG